MERFDVINYFIVKYNFKKYLEIGVFRGDTIRRVKAVHKDGVDPGIEGETVPEVNYLMGSDDFFELIKSQNSKKYDIIFIDGLHHSEQVTKDINNSLNHLTDNGIIILHDCNPLQELHSLVPRVSGYWNGDVYKSVLNFRKNNTHTYFTIDTDCGCGVIIKDYSNKIICDNSVLQKAIESWGFFDKNRKEVLNLISVEDFILNY